jgi:hypothetical protein
VCSSDLGDVFVTLTRVTAALPVPKARRRSLVFLGHREPGEITSSHIFAAPHDSGMCDEFFDT